MKKQGFTLMELLAVIVILAIIALISTPTILGVIEKTRKGSIEQSALGYIDAVEKQIAIGELDDSKSIKDRSYSVEELTNLGVTVKGTTPDNGNVLIENGQVKSYILGFHEYVVENGKAEKGKTTKYENGTAVYYNPTTGKSCSESEAVSTTGTKTGCMKWYTFNDEEGSSTVNLILDHNTTAKIAWNTENKNVAYEDSNIKPEVDKLTSESKWTSTPRLITANEVAKITNNTDWANTSGMYCFESGKQDFNSLPWCNDIGTYGWLYDYTYCKAESYDWKCLNSDDSTVGYWTSTTFGTAGSGFRVYYIYRNGSMPVDRANYIEIGVRPIITISKSILS